jgi:hypothetical protein
MDDFNDLELDVLAQALHSFYPTTLGRERSVAIDLLNRVDAAIGCRMPRNGGWEARAALAKVTK